MKNKKKNSDKSYKYLMIVFVLLFLASVSIVFAAVTSTLKIEGFGAINNAKWSVHFDNLRPATIIGQTKEIKKPTIQSNSTAIASYDVLFTQPGDGVTYVFDVVNDGDLKAELSNFTLGKPLCKGNVAETATADEKLVCDNLSYTITYQDGSTISVNDVLNVGDRKTMKLTLQYNGTKLPQNVVNISSLGISLIYTQKD